MSVLLFSLFRCDFLLICSNEYKLLMQTKPVCSNAVAGLVGVGAMPKLIT